MAEVYDHSSQEGRVGIASYRLVGRSPWWRGCTQEPQQANIDTLARTPASPPLCGYCGKHKIRGGNHGRRWRLQKTEVWPF